MRPLISIVICTRNRSQWLGRCLQSLLDQVWPTPGYEILVVDNASNDETSAIVEAEQKRMPALRYLCEHAVGLSHARNTGMRAAQGDWLVFLDDDARVLDDWAERALTHAKESEFDLIGGVYTPWYFEGKQRWFRDEDESNAGIVEAYGPLPDDEYASGGVFMVRRQAAVSVGGFANALGMSGDVLGYGEETKLQVRMREQGYRLGMDPEWKVAHAVRAVKQSVRWQLASAYASGRASWVSFNRFPDGYALMRTLRRLVIGPFGGLHRELQRGGMPRYWQNWLLAALRPVALALGAFREVPSARQSLRAVHQRRLP